jgi:ELWxxDGT repeat protein
MTPSLPTWLLLGLVALSCAPVEPEPPALLAAVQAPQAACEPVFLLRDILPGATSGPLPSWLTPFNGALVFTAYDAAQGNELWRSDGTPAGTVLLKDIHPGSGTSNPAYLTVAGGQLFFSAYEPTHGIELWKTDGTTAGTVLVKDIRPGVLDGDISNLVEVDGTLFFTAWNGSAGRDLWKSDGTEAGTVLVKDLPPSNSSFSPGFLTAVGRTLYFFHTDSAVGTELWKSDGTEAGTVLVKDITPGPSSWERFPLGALGDTFLFAAHDGVTGYELWRTDGTEAGTVLVKDLQPGADSSFPTRGRVVGGTLFFAAQDREHGQELWKTDGTEAGTVLVRDIRPGAEESRPLYLTEVDGQLFFIARSASGGSALWRSDGTEAGTAHLADISPQDYGPIDYQPHAAAGLLFFTGTTAETGRELWRSDGTEGGTLLVHDIVTGTGSSQPRSLTHVGRTLFFAAHHPASGTELWASATCPMSLTCPAPVSADATSESGATVSLPPVLIGGEVFTPRPQVVYSPPSGPFPIGTTPVTATATWPSGEVRSCTFDVTVRDATPPELRCPPDQMAEATGPSGAPVDYPPATATDGNSLPVVTYSRPSGSTFPLGQTPITVTAEDAAGNTSTCTFRISVRDTTPPDFRCPRDMTVPATSRSGAEVYLPAPEMSDAVSTPTAVYDPPSGSVFRVGTTDVLLRVVDAAGNEDRCTFSVTVEEPRRLNPWSCGGCGAAPASGATGWLLLLLATLAGRASRTRPSQLPLLMPLMALMLWSGCSAGHVSTPPRPTFVQPQAAPSLAAGVVLAGTGAEQRQLLGPDFETLLAPFLSCTSPASFVELQRQVDMGRLVSGLDDWSAVRLGALGPVLPDATEILNRKRASFLVTASQEYGIALAEVFALFIIHSSFDTDLKQVLRQLAQDKRLGQTLGQMPAAREQLRLRGIDLAHSPDRSERPLADSGRGALEATGEVVSSAPFLQTGSLLRYTVQKGQLPPPYQHALGAVESALAQKSLEPGNVLLGLLDEMTFGVPLGFYHLAAGVGHGAYSLTQGQYEQATRELTPAALLVALYAGGKGARTFSEARGAPGTSTGATRALQGLELRLEELKAAAERLRGQLGSESLQELARYLRADPKAALLVAEGGEVGAAALYEARGNVPKAQAWLSQAKSDRPGSSRTRGGAGKHQGGGASLTDDAAGLSREVLDAKLLELELEIPGPRLSRDVAVLEQQLAALEKSPPAGATSHPLWIEYLEYGRERLADLRQGTAAKGSRALEPPLKWEGYQHMRGLWLRGLAFERDMAKLLRDDAALPRAQRRFLQDFEAPRVETYVGVRKPTTDVRFADVLVIEQKPLPGKSPRVETFSFKSRDFSGLEAEAMEAQMKADAREALRKYGGTLEIRRPGLEGLVDVERVRLVYEGGKLKPMDPREQRSAVMQATAAVPEVEVLFR